MDETPLQLIAKELGIRFPIAEWSQKLEISKGSVSQYYNGKLPPSKNFIKKLELFYGINYQDYISSKKVLKSLEPIRKHSLGDEGSPMDLEELNVMLVPLVSQYAHAGYLNGFDDEHYIEELPKVPFTADKEHKGEYICIEVKGDSMEDGTDESYLENDILLCRNVAPVYWQSRLHINKWDFVIVHREKGILVKRIIKHDVERGVITLHSLNDYYDDFDIHLKDVAKIFNIVDFRRKKKRR